MFNLNLTKKIIMPLTLIVLMGASVSVQADDTAINDLTNKVAQNMSTQMQSQWDDMVQVAQAELSLSISTQLAEVKFDEDNEVADSQVVDSNNAVEQGLASNATSK